MGKKNLGPNPATLPPMGNTRGHMNNIAKKSISWKTKFDPVKNDFLHNHRKTRF